MIDEKKLIEALNDTEHSPECVIDIPNNATTQDIINSTLQAYRKLMFECINKQPKVDKWIPCSERMPDEELKKAKLEHGHNAVYPVLITKLELRTNKKCYVVYKAFYDSSTIDYDFFDNRCHSIDDVIAWQPLPESYKESEQ